MDYSPENIVAKVKEATDLGQKLKNEAEIRRLITFIDLTTLSGDDTDSRVNSLTEKAVRPLASDPSIQCAAVCVYPSRVAGAVRKLKELSNSDVKVASVVGGFPSGQYHLESRLLEIKLTAADGADELDTVINRAAALDGQWNVVLDELKAMKKASGNAHLKVILATGELKTTENILRASRVAMDADADFIKTSTGKESTNATLEVAYIMCAAIKEHFLATGKKVGFKPAGGIRTVTEALNYRAMVEIVLGAEWLCPQLFRIGASGLLDDILRSL